MCICFILTSVLIYHWYRIMEKKVKPMMSWYSISSPNVAPKYGIDLFVCQMNKKNVNLKWCEWVQYPWVLYFSSDIKWNERLQALLTSWSSSSLYLKGGLSVDCCACVYSKTHCPWIGPEQQSSTYTLWKGLMSPSSYWTLTWKKEWHLQFELLLSEKNKSYDVLKKNLQVLLICTTFE